MKKRYDRELTIEELAAMPDADIDYSDIPEADAFVWSKAEVEKLRHLVAEGWASGTMPWEGADGVFAKVKQRVGPEARGHAYSMPDYSG